MRRVAEGVERRPLLEKSVRQQSGARRRRAAGARPPARAHPRAGARGAGTARAHARRSEGARGTPPGVRDPGKRSVRRTTPRGTGTPISPRAGGVKRYAYGSSARTSARTNARRSRKTGKTLASASRVRSRFEGLRSANRVAALWRLVMKRALLRDVPPRVSQRHDRTLPVAPPARCPSSLAAVPRRPPSDASARAPRLSIRDGVSVPPTTDETSVAFRSAPKPMSARRKTNPRRRPKRRSKQTASASCCDTPSSARSASRLARAPARAPTAPPRSVRVLEPRSPDNKAGGVGSQGRDDYESEDVEYYFNYMGILADEGSNDRLRRAARERTSTPSTSSCSSDSRGRRAEDRGDWKAGAGRHRDRLRVIKTASRDLARKNNPDKKATVEAMLKAKM